MRRLTVFLFGALLMSTLGIAGGNVENGGDEVSFRLSQAQGLAKRMVTLSTVEKLEELRAREFEARIPAAEVDRFMAKRDVYLTKLESLKIELTEKPIYLDVAGELMRVEAKANRETNTLTFDRGLVSNMISTFDFRLVTLFLHEVGHLVGFDERDEAFLWHAAYLVVELWNENRGNSLPAETANLGPELDCELIGRVLKRYEGNLAQFLKQTPTSIDSGRQLIVQSEQLRRAVELWYGKERTVGLSLDELNDLGEGTRLFTITTPEGRAYQTVNVGFGGGNSATYFFKPGTLDALPFHLIDGTDCHDN